MATVNFRKKGGRWYVTTDDGTYSMFGDCSVAGGKCTVGYLVPGDVTVDPIILDKVEYLIVDSAACEGMGCKTFTTKQDKYMDTGIQLTDKKLLEISDGGISVSKNFPIVQSDAISSVMPNPFNQLSSNGVNERDVREKITISPTTPLLDLNSKESFFKMQDNTNDFFVKTEIEMGLNSKNSPSTYNFYQNIKPVVQFETIKTTEFIDNNLVIRPTILQTANYDTNTYARLSNTLVSIENNIRYKTELPSNSYAKISGEYKLQDSIIKSTGSDINIPTNTYY